MRRDLPAGTVTFLFTDVEGSTRLLHELGAEAYADALAAHRRVVRAACGAHGGVEVDTQGDAFFVAFPTAHGALAAADEVLRGLADGPIRVRVGIHTGTPHVTEEGYVGADVHRAARIAAAGHGGQVLVSSATAALAGLDGLRDLGLHRLKDLSAPERLYQVGHALFPPPKSLHATNLPVPATPFLGRDRELADVVATLGRDDVRLLTLTGPGGIGKTRLGLQAAAAAADAFPHGVWWVPLAPLRDPRVVLEAAATAVGAKEGLAEHVGDKAMLLLLDNFEHVVDAAGDVAALLARCPRLVVLVSSREPLRISGEHEYAVPPLAPGDAAALFRTRARAVDPAFAEDAAVAEICRRVDDLPLAVELAAARVKALAPRQILERLDRRLPLLTGGARDLPERQRTLRATIEWSHDLLDAEEQRLFARLGVFRRGCRLDAAEAVADAELDVLQSLVDKSLVRRTAERFWMLETIREFALERLDASGEAAALRRRHAGWFLALAEEAAPHVTYEDCEWIERLESEHDNLRAALDELDGSEEGVRLTVALGGFWSERVHLGEGQRRIERALAVAVPGPLRARLLLSLSDLAVHTGDTARAVALAEEASALLDEDDPWLLALADSVLGYAVAESGDHTRGGGLFARSVTRFREVGDEFHAARAARSLAWTHYSRGDRARARTLHEENLERARARGDDRLVGASLGSLATLAVDEGRVDDALVLVREAHEIALRVGDDVERAINVVRCARVLAHAGDARLAAELLAHAEAVRESSGWHVPWAAALAAATRAALEEALGGAALAAARERGAARPADEVDALVLRSPVPRP